MAALTLLLQTRFPNVTHDNAEAESILKLTEKGVIKWRPKESVKSRLFDWHASFTAKHKGRHFLLEARHKVDDGLWTATNTSELFLVETGRKISLGSYYEWSDHVETLNRSGSIHVKILANYLKDKFAKTRDL